MRSAKTRALSLLLALMIVVGLSPGTAWAASFDGFFSSVPVQASNGTGATAWSPIEEDGVPVLRSPSGKSYSSCDITLTITADTEISFEYRISSKEGSDYFKIEQNGTALTEKTTPGFSGEVGWTTYHLPVNNGDKLVLGYKKSGTTSAGSDRMWLRNFAAGEGVTVTFHNGNETDTQKIYGEKGTLKANTFTKDHAVFAGWTTAENGTVAYEDGATIEATAPLNLYAVWANAYVVTFDDNGTTSTQNVIQNGTLSSLPIPKARAGYTFEGWFSGETALTTDTKITGDITCTAKFTPITYTIKFSANGGTGTMEDITATYDQTVALPKNTFTREGYHFQGWGTSSYSSSATYRDGVSVSNLKNTQSAVQTLYAVWAGNPVPVTIDPNYEGADITERQCVVGQNYNYVYNDNSGSLSTLADPVRTGHNFKGWYTAAEGGTQVTNQTKFTAEDAEKGVTLYARWAEAVTVTFDPNGGSCYTTSKVVDKGSAYGSLPSASLSGKKFVGWFTAAESGEQVDQNTVFSTDVTLYAQYRSYQLVITFDANGGTGEMDTCIVLSGAPTALPRCGFTREGYRFVKWTTIKSPSSWQSPKYYEDGAEYSWSTSSYYGSDSTQTLYAVWEESNPEPPTPEIPGNPTPELQNAVAALGEWYKLYPVFDADTNVNAMVQADLKEKGFEDITISVQNVTATNGSDDGTSGIASNGDITYFYADPNGMRGAWCGTYRVDFTLTKGDGTVTLSQVPVIVYWDVDKAKGAMTTEILDKVTEESILADGDTVGAVTKDLSLPKVVDGKKWTLISWTSSDENVISISGKNQSTADTLFDPYVGVVKPGETAKEVTLTATFDFQRVNNTNGGSEGPITLSKVFAVTVPSMGDAEAEKIRQGLLAKLDAGFTAKGLTDAATGEKLLPDESGIYTASNDIQLPTTRDFGVDGKYYPVTITTDDGTLKAPDVNNAARVAVYRPDPTQEDATGTITVTLHDKDTSVTASREFKIKVPSLTQEEIDAELELMAKVKAAYFDGIKGNNTARDDVRSDLSPFFEVYQGEDGQLVWVRNVNDKTGRGIVPVPIEGWEEMEAWRLFKSSNPAVISHENLIVTRQANPKAVTITSHLSSETLGRYGELYVKDPETYAVYAQCAGLYNQEVTTDAAPQTMARKARAVSAAPADTIVVRGTADPESAEPVIETVDVSFTLRGLGENWIDTVRLTGLDETWSAYDVLNQVLSENGYTFYRKQGTYVYSIQKPDGTELREKALGENSGWLYQVNGRLPDVYMGACGLHTGDRIIVYYTEDASKDDPNWNWPDHSGGSGSSGSGGSSGSSGASSSSSAAETPDQTIQVTENKSDNTYIVTLPKDSAGPQRVTIPAGKDGQVVVIVQVDGSERVIKKSLTADGKAQFLLEEGAAIRLTDRSKDFSDVSSEAWYASAVDFVSSRDIFSGVGGGRFAPGLSLSRGMLAKVLFNLEGPNAPSNSANLFDDVKDGAWYTKSIAWAAGQGIVSGYGDGRFGPDDPITREQLAVMLYRYAVSLGMSTGGRDSLTGFSDRGQVSLWAAEAVAWAVDSGIIHGQGNGKLAPSGTATRAEAATMICRLVALMVKAPSATAQTPPA